MAQYDPLYDFLVNMHSAVGETILTFRQIEQILAEELPASAHTHRAWWANELVGSHVQAKAWMEAGWNVETVNQQDQWVQFSRIP